MIEKADKYGREIRVGDFILVRPVNLNRIEPTCARDAEIIGRVVSLEGLHGDVGTLYWPRNVSHDQDVVLANDFFHCRESLLLLRSDGKLLSSDQFLGGGHEKINFPIPR